MEDDKYVVFKRDEWLEFVTELANRAGPAVHELLLSNDGALPIVALTDAVVIRCRDVFAPPALDAYANSIQVVVEAMRATTVLAETEMEVNRLSAIADYFHQRAAEAWQTDRKLPD